MSGPGDDRRALPERAGTSAESYVALLARISLPLVVLVGIVASSRWTRPGVIGVVDPPSPSKAIASRPEAPIPATKEPDPVVVLAPEPPPLAPRVAPERLAAASGAAEAAAGDRARAEARAEDAGRRLAAATSRAAAATAASRSLASRVQDPTARISAASTRGEIVRVERDRLKREIASIGHAPRPKAKVLSNKNPVARPSEGDEHHFELRGDRIAVIDLERLLELVKADAQLRIRLSDGARVVNARVGPVGAFALQYSLMRSIPLAFNDIMDGRSVSYNLRSWEVVPEFEGRGETFETIQKPISDFARAVNRLTPGRSTVTLWVYPDAFPLYRKVRDELHGRGFLVAARPLPQGMAIRGSPSGSLSAGQ